jgi:DHA1 family bicyclomycin/chloramphenicol resistance-like MFS transporter
MRPPRPQSPARLALVLGTLTAFGPLSIDMYLPGLPAIAGDFGVPTADVGLTLVVFFAGLAVGQAFYGPIADRVGRRPPLLVGCVIYALASVGCALAPTFGSLILLRLAQALGGCAGMVIARSVVRDRFDATESARMYSLLTLVMGLAPVTAPLIGGQILATGSWRAIFWLLAAFGALCLALVLFALPESLPAERRARGGLGAVLGVYRELLSDRRFVGYALAGGFVSAGMFAYISGSPFVVIELHGVSPQRYGWIFGANALGLIAASQLNRWLLSRFTSHGILGAGLAVCAGSGLLLTLVAATGFGGLVGLLVPLFICIASVGLIGPNSAAAAMAPYGRAAGSASALMGTLQFTVGAGAGALVGALHNGTALPMAGVIAACGLLGLVAFASVGASEQVAAIQA